MPNVALITNVQQIKQQWRGPSGGYRAAKPRSDAVVFAALDLLVPGRHLGSPPILPDELGISS